MKVLALVNMYPPHHYGGYELVCHEALEHLRRQGHHVEVLTSTVRVAGQEGTPEWADEVHRSLQLYWDDHLLLSPPLRERLRIERANQQALADAIDRVQPDVVSVWAMGAMSLGLLTTVARRGVPTLHVACDEWALYAGQLDAWARLFRGWRRPLGWLVERATGVPCLPDPGAGATFCFISADTRSAFDRSRWQFPDRTVVYCGINERAFPIGTWPPRSGWSWRLLCVGRIDERKGLATAIRALPLLPAEATLQIDGRGDESHLRELRALAAGLGVADRVHFTVSDRADLAALYAGADVLVFPVTWSEPFGLVPLEAMACATPVVATATGGSSEYLYDGRSCLRFPPGDHEALAAAVRRLAGDAGLRARLVETGLRTARELTMERWARLLEEWHVAVGDRFAHGRPTDRPPIEAVVNQ